VDPSVRINPLDASDRAAQTHGQVRIEFSRKRVVRNSRSFDRSNAYGSNSGKSQKFKFHMHNPILDTRRQRRMPLRAKFFLTYIVNHSKQGAA
jgi:hypothetical protein